jgi:hypothetical protein
MRDKLQLSYLQLPLRHEALYGAWCFGLDARYLPEKREVLTELASPYHTYARECVQQSMQIKTSRS